MLAGLSTIVPDSRTGLLALIVGGKLIQVDPGPSRFVVSIRVSKASQFGDTAARRLSRAIPVSPGSCRSLGDEHTQPAQWNSYPTARRNVSEGFSPCGGGAF